MSNQTQSTKENQQNEVVQEKTIDVPMTENQLRAIQQAFDLLKSVVEGASFFKYDTLPHVYATNNHLTNILNAAMEAEEQRKQEEQEESAQAKEEGANDATAKKGGMTAREYQKMQNNRAQNKKR